MSRVKVQNSDGGKLAEGFSHETNDCTVRALANSTGLSYKESHRLARVAGRRDRHGMKYEQVKQMMAELAKGGNYEVKELLVPQPAVTLGSFWSRRPRRQRVGGISVNEFLWKLPKKGQFYLCCTSHAFAVVDGVLRDPRQMSRAKMALAFEIIPVTKAAPVAPVQTETPERLAEMERMKKRIAELEAQIARQKEMEEMKKRIAELEKRLAPKAMAAGAGR